ncbi:hypothetical protein CUMW_168310 [Citrus unshiu]|uniref:RING-type domain-containing protein n=1 Tax=Citrus unshiu TaxID=55188 RepID=A0A2H5PUD6_CITUN|nr:hypothetical protein CUMW_168310 [Citrus unshiu]
MKHLKPITFEEYKSLKILHFTQHLANGESDESVSDTHTLAQLTGLKDDATSTNSESVHILGLHTNHKTQMQTPIGNYFPSSLPVTAISGAIRLKNDALKPSQVSSELSDDDASLNNSREEGLECPICWESFNVVENLPYVLWCGHTLCKNCVLGLQRAVIRLPTLPFQLPFFITCPWCNMVSLRLICKGNLRFPQKNYYLLWMVESMNGDRSKSNPHFRGDHQPASSLNRNSAVRNQVSHAHNGRATCSHVSRQSEIRRDEGRFLTGHLNAERLQLSLRKSLVFFAQLTAKFPLIIPQAK